MYHQIINKVVFRYIYNVGMARVKTQCAIHAI